MEEEQYSVKSFLIIINFIMPFVRAYEFNHVKISYCPY